MDVERTAWHESESKLTELSAEFAGWRIGLGGSGHWWAVRGNELVRTPDVDELRARLHELGDPR